MLVRDVEHPRTALQDLGELGGVHQAFERAVGDEGRGAERADRRRQALEGDRGAGRADRDGRLLARRGHDDVERARAELEQRELREPDVQRARLGLRKNRAGVARRHFAFREDVREQVDPLALDPVGQHGPAIVIESGT